MVAQATPFPSPRPVVVKGGISKPHRAVSRLGQASKVQRALSTLFEEKVGSSPSFFALGARAPGRRGAGLLCSPLSPAAGVCLGASPDGRRRPSLSLHPAFARLRAQDHRDHPPDRVYRLTPAKDSQLSLQAAWGRHRLGADLEALAGELEGGCSLRSAAKAPRPHPACARRLSTSPHKGAAEPAGGGAAQPHLQLAPGPHGALLACLPFPLPACADLSGEQGGGPPPACAAMEV